MHRRRLKRVVLGVILSLALIGAGGAYTAWRLSWQEPTWYHPPDPKDLRVVTLADDAEYAMLEQSQKIRPKTEPWTLRLTQQQMNAWLAARLPAWIEHDANLRWPEQIGTPQVLIESDGVSIAAPVMTHGVSRTVVARLKPAVAPDGRLSLKLTRISLGRVWLPGEPLGKLSDAVRDAAPEFLDSPRVKQTIEVLAGRRTLSPHLVLADGRRVTVTSVHLDDGALELVARTDDGSPDDGAGSP
jgi:uncharacterized protein YpmS